ncbi:MAG: hypothetical protein R3F56_08695 [Planctomycetota bacterium]
MLCALLLSLQAPEPAFVVHNPSALAQDAVLVASLPLPRHWQARDLAELRVGDDAAVWTPLQRWPDGSLALVQVHWRTHLAGAARVRSAVHCLPRARAAPPPAAVDVAGSWPSPLPLHTELVDPWGRVHTTSLRLARARDAGFVHEREFEGVHVSADSGSSLLGARVFLAWCGAERAGELTVVLDNGRCRDAGSVGPVRFTRFSIVVGDERLRLRPRWAVENLLRPPVAVDDDGASGYRQDLLGPSPFLYLGDGTAKAFRFDAAWDVGDATAGAALAERVDHAAYAFADLDWVRATGVFGVHGGPAPLASATDDLAAAAVGEWQRDAEFGPFGGFGDTKEAVALGSARQGPSALHNVLRWRSRDLLEIARAQVLQGLLRPLPGHIARLPDASRGLRQGLSERAVQQPHGFEPLEYEGISVDLLYDAWWLTGDVLAREELGRTGAAVRRLLDRLPFATSRGEGLCARALVACALATGDADLLAWTAQRMRAVVLPRLRVSPLVALAQPPHPQAFDGAVPFDAPWQMAALVCGLHALFVATDAQEFADAAVEVARRMATHGWVEGRGPKYLMHATDPRVFCLPRAHDPLQGTARFELGAFVLARELATDDLEAQSLFARRALAIADAARTAGVWNPAARADRWMQLWLDRHERRE